MINSIGVHIKVKDFKTSVAFYKALGFKKIFEYGPDKEVKEKYNGMTFGHGDSRLEIADGHIAVSPKTFQETVQSAKISLMVNVDSIKTIMDKCAKAKIPLAVGPKHYYWGTIEIVVRDPDGVIIVFICPYSKEEEKKVFAKEVLQMKPW